METLCPQCNKLKEGVQERDDNYVQEIYGEDGATWIACDDCQKHNDEEI